MRILKVITALTVFFSLGSCKKDSPKDPEIQTVSVTQGHRVYITNEGNFNTNNAGVTIYQPSNGQLVTDYYKNQNNNAVLGDICQSMIKANNNFYLVINNSGKITVVDADEFKLKGNITGLTSPRYILPISYTKAYVTDLFSNSVSIVNLVSMVKTGSIPLKGWTENMELLYNKAYITNMQKNYTYVINTTTDAVIDSINVGINAGSIVLDKNNKLWILSSGDNTNSIQGKLTRVDALTLAVEQTITFNLPDSPKNLCINATKDTLYYLNKNVYQLPITATTLPPGAFITSSSNNLYGLAVNDKDYTIYFSDAIDYVQKSAISVYSSTGQFRTLFRAGINSSNFYFE
jgi:YVTN family beta-propeller protein